MPNHSAKAVIRETFLRHFGKQGARIPLVLVRQVKWEWDDGSGYRALRLSASPMKGAE